jgi:hypothetical protein
LVATILAMVPSTHKEAKEKTPKQPSEIKPTFYPRKVIIIKKEKQKKATLVDLIKAIIASQNWSQKYRHGQDSNLRGHNPLPDS